MRTFLGYQIAAVVAIGSAVAWWMCSKNDITQETKAPIESIISNQVANNLPNKAILQKQPDALPKSSPYPGAAIPTSDEILRRVGGPYVGDGKELASQKLSASVRHSLNETYELLSQIEEADEQSVVDLIQQLKSKQSEFIALSAEADQWLQKHNLRDSVLAQQIEQRFTDVQTVVNAVVIASTPEEQKQEITKAKALFAKLKPPVTSEQSYGVVPSSELAPLSLIPDDIPDAPPPAYASPNNKNNTVQLENAWSDDVANLDINTLFEAIGISEAHAGTAPALPNEASTCNSMPADVGNALPEIDLSDPEIQALAAQLEYSPIKIYSYVKNNIEFQPWLGYVSIKGALGTLRSGEGNATDQASLLIALLRASNIPARYVFGSIGVKGAGLQKWYGTKTQAAALSRIEKVTGLSHNQLYHVWVEACVPYDNYRGSNSDNSGFHWIPLDASFKEMVYTDGPTVKDIPDFSFNFDAYYSKRTNIAPHEALLAQMEEVLGGPLANGGGYRGKIVKKEIDILPSTLPYRVHAFKAWSTSHPHSEIAGIPDDLRMRVEFDLINDDFGQYCAYFGCFTLGHSGKALTPTLSIDLPSLATKRLTLSFAPAPNAHPTVKSTYNNWLLNGGALPCELPHGVVATYMLDGKDITPGAKSIQIPFCKGATLYGQVYRGDRAISHEFNGHVMSYNYHALQAHGMVHSEKQIIERTARLLRSIKDNPNPVVSQDDTLGEYLHLAGIKYIGYRKALDQSIGNLYGTTGDYTAFGAVTRSNMKVTYLFDIPLAVSSGDFILDNIGRGWTNSIDISTGERATFEEMDLESAGGSFYESYLWQEHAQRDAVSTTRGFQFANEEGMTFVELFDENETATKLNQNCNTTSENFNYTASQISGIKSYLVREDIISVYLPECQINYPGWIGAVYQPKSVHGGHGSIIDRNGSIDNGGIGLDLVLDFDDLIDANFLLDTAAEQLINMYADELGQLSIYHTEWGVGDNINTTWGGDPVNLVSGNMYHPERDIHLKGRGGLDLVFERTYNSHDRKNGSLGYGWTHSFNHYLTFFDNDGPGGNANPTSNVIWMDGTGNARSFDVNGTQDGIATGHLFTNQKGIYVTAKRDSDGRYSIKEKNGLTFYFESVAGKPGNVAKLVRVIDKNGNKLTLNYTGSKLNTVVDDLNRALTFYYDDNNNHITRVIDRDDRTYRYIYSNNNLVEFKTPKAIAGLEESTDYAYYTAADGTNLDHAMKSFTRPNGYGMTFQYYTNGQVFRHTDGKGKSFTFRYNNFKRETITTDERGITQTYLFNKDGQQIQHTQGDETQLKYEYADTNNPLNETKRRHVLGYETQYAYDLSGDLTKTTLPDGSTLEYSGRGGNNFHLPCSVKDSNDNYVLYRYDDKGNRTDTIALKDDAVVTTSQAESCSYTPPNESILSWSINAYDDYGNLTKSTQVKDFSNKDAQSPYVEYIYDATNLNPETIRHCGLQQNVNGTLEERCEVATQTFDMLGRITQGVNGALYENKVEYDANGRISRATDALGQWREFEYDDNGNLTSTSLIGKKADGTVGFLLHNTAQYDELDRPISQSNIAGYKTYTEYDEIGNITKVTNPDGFNVHFEYDEQNRPTKAYDEHGRAVTTEYDIGGRPIKVTDPNGISTDYEYYGASENGPPTYNLHS